MYSVVERDFEVKQTKAVASSRAPNTDNTPYIPYTRLLIVDIIHLKIITSLSYTSVLFS